LSGVRSADDKASVDVGVVSNNVRVEEVSGSAIGGATESEMSGREWSAAISVQPATIAVVPR
jgi:hypothetical protein